ncbi:carbohydrate sulfotransferase 1-like isoform X3 [Crassostrea angulata]|uniref:carbohydrate sulfotransferase 1-like isoform X3 n=1 Tax=Magallana angulata TaxID=2784310 RepID=UPI0022B0F926|nr:carbohydrate sulfotransferase 1-like isoform X3 [Crassostrea angulata]
MLHRTIFSARSVSVFLGSTLLFYVALIGTGKGQINKLYNLSMHGLFCLSDPKQIHLTDHYYSKENTRMRLVLAYMRGGSTLTAEIVRHTEADFYQFEPLHGITNAVQKNRPVQFLNGTTRNITKEELESVYTEMIYHWFTCNFKNIDLPGLTDSFIKFYTPEHEKYYSCINPVKTTKSKVDLVKQCIPILHLKCLESKTRTLKTIRLSVSMAGKLLNWLPRLQVLHLIRDPRGIINSRLEQQQTEGKNVSIASKELCQTMSSNLNSFKELEPCHGIRMIGVVYENLCQNPFIVVPKIFKFFHSNYSTRVKDFVKKLMRGPVKACGYCTNRGNAIANAYRWISIINKNDLKIIDKHCSFLYSNLGYKQLDYNKLNVTKTSWKSLTSSSIGYRYS